MFCVATGYTEQKEEANYAVEVAWVVSVGISKLGQPKTCYF